MIRLWLMTLMLTYAGQSFAGGVTAEVDHTIVELGERINLSLTIEGDFDGNPPEFSIKDVEVRFAGQQSSYSFVNGRGTSALIYNYLLTPTKVMNFKIPSLTLKIDNKEESTLPIGVKVVGVGKGQEGDQTPALFVERELSKSEVYLGEPVVAKIKVFQKIKVLGADIEPSTPSTVKRIPIEGQKNYEELRDGARYTVAEISEILLPVKSGEVTLPPYRVKAKYRTQRKRQQQRRRGNSPFNDMFDMFGGDPFGRSRVAERMLFSNEDKIRVKELPPNAPKSFSGIVGEFQIDASLSKSSVNVGDTSTLTITLQGKGDLKGADGLFNVEQPGVKVYPDKPVIETRAHSSGLLSKATFKYAIVPSVSGTVSFENLKLIVFHPGKGEYESLSFSIPPLEATGQSSAASQTLTQSKEKVSVLGSDLLAAHRGSRLMESHNLSSKWVVGSVVTCSLPLFVGFMGWWRRKYGDNEDFKATRRRSKAYQVFVKKVGSNQSSFDGNTYEAIIEALKVYLGDKLAIQSSALTSRDVEKILQEKRADEAYVGVLVRALEVYNQIKFGGQEVSQELLKDSTEQVLDIVKKLDGGVLK